MTRFRQTIRNALQRKHRQRQRTGGRVEEEAIHTPILLRARGIAAQRKRLTRLQERIPVFEETLRRNYDNYLNGIIPVSVVNLFKIRRARVPAEERRERITQFLLAPYTLAKRFHEENKNNMRRERNQLTAILIERQLNFATHGPLDKEAIQYNRRILMTLVRDLQQLRVECNDSLKRIERIT